MPEAIALATSQVLKNLLLDEDVLGRVDLESEIKVGTASWLAEATGLTLSTTARLLRGVTTPTLPHLWAIASALQLPVHRLVQMIEESLATLNEAEVGPLEVMEWQRTSSAEDLLERLREVLERSPERALLPAPKHAGTSDLLHLANHHRHSSDAMVRLGQQLAGQRPGGKVGWLDFLTTPVGMLGVGAAAGTVIGAVLATLADDSEPPR